MAEGGLTNLHGSSTHSPVEAQWISLSDLMSCLMMLFMLIAIAFMVKVEADALDKQRDVIEKEKNMESELQSRQELYDMIQAQMKKAEAATYKIRQVAVAYDQNRLELYLALVNEFGADMPRWGAEITQDLAVRFNDPEVLFDTGRNDLKPKFQQVMDQFIPRYLKIIAAPKYREMIQEIRIEGHTSSAWKDAVTPDEAYIKNMELSQSRTRSMLNYMLSMSSAQRNLSWLRQHVTANGLSSSQPIYNADGTENKERSQRVEMRIRTNADARLAKILEEEPTE